MNPEFKDLSFATEYEALQLGDEIVMIARGKHATGRIGALRESTTKTDHDLSLFEQPLLAATPSTHEIHDFTAFRAFRSTLPISVVRVRDKQGVKSIRVSSHPEGITQGGTE